MKWLSLTIIISLFSIGANAQKRHDSPSSKNTVLTDYFPNGPSFPGGQKELINFLTQNLKWPDQLDAQGKVIISFIVEKDGRLTNFKVERSMGKAFDTEALRVIKKMPKWIPQMQNGKPVRVKYYLPINFTLSE